MYNLFINKLKRLYKYEKINLLPNNNKMFHADEVTAIALLEIFTDYEIEVERVNHDCQDFYKYDFVIDVSKKFDGIKYFDHHQFKGGKSSAGLIWDYCQVQSKSTHSKLKVNYFPFVIPSIVLLATIDPST